MSIDEGYPNRVISYPTFTELSEILSKDFDLIESSMQYGMPTFVVRWPSLQIPPIEQQRKVFGKLEEESGRLRLWPVVRWKDEEAGEYFIRFAPQQKEDAGDMRINYALFVATLATISLAGFLQATSPVFLTLFYPDGWNIWDIAFVTGTFLLALMGIVFTHEMGHYLTAKRRGIDASAPYFIPGLPQIGGTFGAFIQQKSPPQNRRDLFDLGIAGPLAGFAVTLVVLVAGFLMSVPVTAEQLEAIDAAFPDMTGSLPVPYLFVILQMIFSDFIPPGGTIYLHPIAFASWVGCLVTALNLFPAGQLDGGHALRAIVGGKKHKYIGYVAIAVMFLMGIYLMAILVLFLSRGEHPGPLNDTVPVSKTRIGLFVLSIIVVALSIPPLWQTFTF